MLFLVVLAVLGLYADANPSEPYILFSNITNLYTLDLTTLTQNSVVSGKDYIVPLGIDTKYSHIYYGEHKQGKIFRANYDGSSETLIIENVKNVEGIAIDWIGRNMYWTTYTSETIEVSTLDGKHRKVLINAGLEFPRGMAVDPNAGYLFWSDWGSTAAIERCLLDGSNRKALVTSNITWPNGVTLDYGKKRVYWIDAFHDTIWSVDYNGQNRKLIFEDNSLALSQFHGFDLDITGDSIYFTDWLINSIFGVNVTTGATFTNVTVLTTKSIKGAMGLRIVDKTRQQAGSSNCGNNNGGCEQLCFHKVPSGFTCACQLGMKLLDDKKSCEDAFKDEFIMFADADKGKILQMQLDSRNVKPIAIPFDNSVNITRPVALEYDRVEDRVYWSDVTLKIICRAFRNGSGFEIVHKNVGIVDGLTLDLAGRKIYWTSTTNNTIETSLFDGSYRKVVVKLSLDEPRDIIVDPVHGYMYWSDWGKFPKIERACMNGKQRQDLVNTTIGWPNGLTIDYIQNKLYWADAREDSIEVMNLDTMKRKVILNKKILFLGFLYRLSTQVNHPFGLTLLHDKIYWTDWNTKSVYRADANTAANIVLMTGNLGKPMDIHAYSAIPKQYVQYTYTFSFPNGKGSNFTCLRDLSCPVIPEPPPCPSGFQSVRENMTCGLNCRDIVGYTWRCPCTEWMSCAVKEEYLWGCALGYYASFRVRECSKVVREGRCPKVGGTGSQQVCSKDDTCPTNEKCCGSKCTAAVYAESHVCQTNNGGCDQLCFPVPKGHKCGCQNGYYYDDSQKKCVVDTRPTTAPPTTPPPVGCKPHPAPANGSVTCDGDPVPLWGECQFKCDPGFEILGYSWDFCFFGTWLDPPPKCVVDAKPKFSHCYNDTVIGTDPGKSYATWDWVVPTATDYNGTKLAVTLDPKEYKPPVKLNIGGPYLVRLSARDQFFEYVYCSFNITLEDQEPPSFGSTCPASITKYTDKDQSLFVPEAIVPIAKDNSGKPPTISYSGYRLSKMYPVGRSSVTFTATDDAQLSRKCTYNVSIINVCSSISCSHGALCVMGRSGTSGMCFCNILCPQGGPEMCGSDGNTYVNDCLMRVAACTKGRNITVVKQGKCSAAESCDTVTCKYGAVCQVTDDKVQCVCQSVCAEIYDPVCGSDLVTYENECALNAEMCKKNKTIIVRRKGKCGDCSYLKCSYGANCKVIQGLAKCECELTCAHKRTPVCGSDGVTYRDKCTMLNQQCGDQRAIKKVDDGPCGCDENLELNDDFKKTSNIECKLAGDSLICKVKCQNDTKTVFPNFLNMQCYKKKWIRKNSVGKYVPIGSAKNPPRCYKTTRKSAQGCLKLSTLVAKDVCVPCPPGSYYDSEICKECEVTYYQDQSKQTSCKACSGTKTSTTTGAESCYFDHGSNAVVMVFDDNQAKAITKEKLRTDLAKGLTELCKTVNCSFVDNKARRKKRADVEYVFKEEHIIILGEIKQISSGEKEVTLFVLDPTSTSLLPEAFTSDNLKGLLLKIKSHDLTGIVLKRVDKTMPPSAASSGSESSSKAPVIAGVIVAILVLFGLVFAIWMFSRRRRIKSNEVPPVQFNSADGGQIGHPSTVSSEIYDNPAAVTRGLQHGFVNQVYNDVHAPPPYYETSSIRQPAGEYVVPSQNVYKIPDDGQAGALPAKDQLPEFAVVENIPPKVGAVVDMSSQNADPPVKFFHKRSTIPNVYEEPVARSQASRSRIPDAEAELKLKPPPKFDDARLQVMREKTASSMLPNVPRAKKVDPNLDVNANAATGSQGSSRGNIGDVTKNQSES